MANGVLFTQKRSVNTIRYSVIVLLALLFTFPLLYLVSGSLMTLNEVTVYPPKLLPTTINLQNYVDAMQVMTPSIFGNTLFFTFGILILQLILSFSAGFALAKMPFKYAATVVGLFARLVNTW